MVQDGCIKSIIGAMIPPEGKRKGDLWGNKFLCCQVLTLELIQNLSCALNEPNTFS